MFGDNGGSDTQLLSEKKSFSSQSSQYITIETIEQLQI